MEEGLGHEEEGWLKQETVIHEVNPKMKKNEKAIEIFMDRKVIHSIRVQ